MKQPVARGKEKERQESDDGVSRWWRRSQRTREFNFSVTLHLRSLIPAALCASRGGTERHSIAGLHLRFSIMEIQRALGANSLPLFPLSAVSSYASRPSSVFRGKINKLEQTPTPDDAWSVSWTLEITMVSPGAYNVRRWRDDEWFAKLGSGNRGPFSSPFSNNCPLYLYEWVLRDEFNASVIKRRYSSC